MPKDKDYYVAPVEDVSGPHSEHDPFCSDLDCPCHTDPELIDGVMQQMNDGLLTGAEATRTFFGRQV